jgi:hypothetical protein
MKNVEWDAAEAHLVGRALERGESACRVNRRSQTRSWLTLNAVARPAPSRWNTTHPSALEKPSG